MFLYRFSIRCWIIYIYIIFWVLSNVFHMFCDATTCCCFSFHALLWVFSVGNWFGCIHCATVSQRQHSLNTYCFRFNPILWQCACIQTYANHSKLFIDVASQNIQHIHSVSAVKFINIYDNIQLFVPQFGQLLSSNASA